MSEISPAERVARARAAQVEWRRVPVAGRTRVLRKLRQEIARERERIAETVRADTGKPRLDALAGDVLVTLEQLRFYENNADRILAPRTLDRPALFWVGTAFEECYEPHGVTLIFGPANYPLQLSVVPMVTALFAGNAVILKCSERTPRTAALIRELCGRSGLSQALLQVSDEGPEEAGALIDAGPDLIFFTGSHENGRSVAERAAKQLIPVVLELGGKDAALVFADCPWERAIEGVTYGAFSNAGQVCVGVKRLYVERVVFEPFIKALVGRTAALRVGEEPDADLGIVQGPAIQERLQEQVQDAIARGARVLFPDATSISARTPVILTDVPVAARVLTEETFGPVLCVAPFDTEAKAVELANGSRFALSCSLWTRDPARGRRVAAQMTAGTCAVNDVIRNIANPYAAFGGNRDSGYGRYHGPEGLRTFSRIKTVMVAKAANTRERAWFPFTERTFRQLSAIIGLRHGTRGMLSQIGRRLFPLLLWACLPLALKGQVAQSDLHIQVDLPAHSHGDIGYLIFDSADGFPGDAAKALRRGFVADPAGAAKVMIDAGHLPPGRYAVTVYQDVNGNRKLDHGFLGIPKEPVGGSNNPHAHFGPPSFKDCEFLMGPGDKTITIRLVKP